MVERRDRAGVVWAALIGTAWGIGLARFVAEVSFSSFLYSSPWGVLGVAVACGAVATAAYSAFAPSPCDLIPLGIPALYAFGVAKGPLAGGVLLSGSVVMTLGLVFSRLRRLTPPSLLAILIFSLYLRTLLRSAGQADTLEFQVVVPLLRVAHPTGYPLYILITHPFSWLPIGSVAFRVNLASAVYATGAVLTLYFLLNRLSMYRWVAFLAATAFGVSAVFWSQAIIAEVYTLHNLLVALTLFLLVGRQGDKRRWPLVCLLLGGSLANHLTTALLLPAAMLSLAQERPRLPLRTWGGMIALFLLGLALYLYIPLRWPAVNDGEHISLEHFVNHVTAQQFRGALQWDGWRDPTRWSIVGRVLVAPYGWPGLVLAAIGVTDWLRGRRWVLVITGVTFAAFVLYGLNYHVPDISVFLIPASLILALWMGAGIGSIMESAQRIGRRACARAVILALAGLLPMSLIWTNLPTVDLSHENASERWGRYVLSLPIDAESVILADVERFAPLHYLTDVERIRSDLDVVILGEESLYRAEIDARLQDGQTVYLARYLSHMEQYSLTSVGPLALVSQTPQSRMTSPEVVVGTVLGEFVRLLGYDVHSADALPQEPLRLTLYWQAEGSISGDYVVRVRLVDSEGHVRWENEGSHPVSGLYPTNAWRLGEIVTDYYELAVPSHLWGEEYLVQVGLFPPFADEGLETVDGLSWVSLTSIYVAAGEPPRLANRTQASLGDQLWITGFELPGEVPVGGPIPVTLEWRGEAGGRPTLLHFAWMDRAGHIAVADQSVWLNPASALAFHTRSLLSAPAPAGDYTLLVGWASEEGGQALSLQCTWLTRSGQSCPVTTVLVSPGEEGLANLDGKVLLVSAEVGAEQLTPGAVLPVVLHWRALARMPDDYTVTVQLIGPDGRLHGQVDAWPIEGTFPTSEWEVGQEIDDRYLVALDAEVPVGRYQVVVGWYLLQTMERLPVVDGAGRPVADHVVIAELELISP